VGDFRNPALGGKGDGLPGSVNSPVHYFTAPSVKPAMKCFCIRKNMATGGRAARIEPALTRCHWAIHWPFSDDRPAVIGWLSTPCVSTVAQKKSFQMKVKTSTLSAAMAGRIRGRTMY